MRTLPHPCLTAGVNVGGDAGKTTILDALGLILSLTNAGNLSDTDHYLGRIDSEFANRGGHPGPVTVALFERELVIEPFGMKNSTFLDFGHNQTSMIGTNLRGRVRNVSLPSNGLMPLFEAVSNSIHAIEEAGRAPDEGRIKIEIRRSAPRLLLDPDHREIPGDIEGFTVTDNGIGFNEANFKSFRTLDSEHKVAKGGRGVGRLLWLKAFESVSVESVFKDEDGKVQAPDIHFRRNIRRERRDSRGNRRPRAAPTTIGLSGFRDRYRQRLQDGGVDRRRHCRALPLVLRCAPAEREDRHRGRRRGAAAR